MAKLIEFARELAAGVQLYTISLSPNEFIVGQGALGGMVLRRAVLSGGEMQKPV
ncbi:hypothetical protein [Pseudooceanicola sp. HF7]|uniref:hypothetical protein n=1 Tax=Pseudooceanicola sp. HF7 TaxID=2721560 RepID=UPI00143115BA|nr:hypothetical protein [Pseudooceanicola sp. HF7]NIZ09509.1 hypothetical protein [Pseudooceanicola sp. HF7]